MTVCRFPVLLQSYCKSASELFIKALLMAKGKIQITPEDPSQAEAIPQNVQDQEQGAHEGKHHQIEKKHRKKDKKKTKPKVEVKNKEPLLETIINLQERKQAVKEKAERLDQVTNNHSKNYKKIHQKREDEDFLEEKITLNHVAICIPDSILQLPQTSTLRAYFISEIARLCSIFKVDEIIILRDQTYKSKSEKFNPSEYLARNLQYLQTPQYLRKYLFKMHPDLQNVGLMNPIQSQHHLKADEVCQFREGVALDRPVKKGKGSWVDVGLRQQAQIQQPVLAQTRLTVRLKNSADTDPTHFEAEPVSKKTPKIQQNLYWGYDVRMAQSLQDAIAGQQGHTGYDVKICCYGNSKNLKNSEGDLTIINQFKNTLPQQSSLLLFYPGTQIKVQELDLSEFQYSFEFKNIGVKQLRLEEQMFMSLNKLREWYF